MLSQFYFLIPPRTTAKTKVSQTVLLAKGTLKQIIVRFLSGCGKKTCLSIHHNGKVLYRSSFKNPLTTRGFIEIDLDDYALPLEFNQVELRGYSKDKDQVSRVKVDFGILPESLMER